MARLSRAGASLDSREKKADLRTEIPNILALSHPIALIYTITPVSRHFRNGANIRKRERRGGRGDGGGGKHHLLLQRPQAPRRFPEIPEVDVIPDELNRNT